ncbi:MAG: DUF512 domain-containing protein [Anaerolineales bacterium]
MTHQEKFFPAEITAVDRDSLAERVGLRAGDVLLSIAGQPLRDVIDVRAYAAEPYLALVIEREGQRLEIEAERRYGEPLGLNFAQELFDGPPRVCCNRCEFCFVAQMPRGFRPALYVKDDDYRLSFLHGNYITLTNWSEADWQRVEAQFLSPLYISVHAVDPQVRAALMRHPRAGQIMAQLTRLAEMRVTLHTQAVLVPGVNDGPQLDRTIRELAALYPAVADVSIVPVGLTRRHAPGLRPYTPAEARAVLDQIQVWQERLMAEFGRRFVYPADEWFFLAAAPLPSAATYDDRLPALIENGVGMARCFIDRWAAVQTILREAGGDRQTWVTGALFAPLLRDYAARFQLATGIAAEVVAAPNRTFGETVTVAGLLTAADVLAALEKRFVGDVVVLPAEIFRGPGGRTLDDQTTAALQAALRRPLLIVATHEDEIRAERVG